MTLKELLIQYEIQNDKSHAEVAEEIGISLSTYYRWLSGESTHIKKTKIKRLSEVLHCDVEQVIEDMNRVKPILGRVKAGYDLWADQDVEGYVEVGHGDTQNGDYFLRVTGDSMIESHIYEGDLVYVQQCNNVESGKIAVVMIGDEVTIKIVKFLSDGILLEASNPKYDNRKFTFSQVEELPVRIIGKVRFVRRDFI